MRELEPIFSIFFAYEIFIIKQEINMVRPQELKSKIVLTLNSNQENIKNKRSSAYTFVERNLKHLIGENVPETIYIGGDRDLVIRYLAHLINTSSFEVDVVDDTSKFIFDPDFES